MKKKILIIGNGAKEYALARKLSENYEIYVTPSGDAIKEFVTCLDIREDNVKELLEFVMENGIDLTIPCSVTSIKSDIVSKFTENKQQVFAPSANAAEITYNKVLAKKTLYKLRIPTPKFGIFEKQNQAMDYIKNQQIPFVMKTNDSNSAVIITSSGTAKNIAEMVYAEKDKRLIIEDYVYGTPFFFYTLTDGYKALPIGNSLAYKHSLDGDGGQLTSGMGACIPNCKLTIEHEYFIMDNVIYPVLEYLDKAGKPYLGILGVNGIITDDGEISVLGWQSFLQDCDAAGILEGIDDDLYDLFEACIIGSFSDEVNSINLNDKLSVSLVLNCTNKVNNSNIINGLDNLDEDTLISFYPSVKKNKYLEYEAENGPLMVLTGLGYTYSSASEKVYSDAEDIQYSGKFHRKDICRV